jgi:hypothetical protein
VLRAGGDLLQRRLEVGQADGAQLHGGGRRRRSGDRGQRCGQRAAGRRRGRRRLRGGLCGLAAALGAALCLEELADGAVRGGDAQVLEVAAAVAVGQGGGLLEVEAGLQVLPLEDDLAGRAGGKDCRQE